MAYDGAISNAYATGSVTGTGGYVGGLAGYNSGTISNAYATSAVTSSGFAVGGLVGYNYGATVPSSSSTTVYFGIIHNTYATGAVSSPYTVGGLVGENQGGTATASFFDTQKAGKARVSAVAMRPA